MTAVRAVVAHALRNGAKYNSDSSAPPAAVFWPDPDRVWEPVIGLLQEAVPILVLGDYDDSKAQGPAIWIRAVLGAPESADLPAHLAEHSDKNPWVIYLPGLSRSSLSDLTSLDPAVSPLVEVALRSNWWPSAHGQAPWTPHSFLGSKYGADLGIAGDAQSRLALAGVLESLLAEDVEGLRRIGRLDAARLHSLVMSDSVRTMLEWLEDPDGIRSALQGARWSAFVAACRTTYSFDPVKDGVISAAARLGAREGTWADVWARYADNPRRYPDIPAKLDQARPEGDLFGDTDQHPDSWPSWNREQEDDLRKSLAALGDRNDLKQVCETVRELAAVHLRREESVWGELGQAPLAKSTGLLAEIAELTMVGSRGTDIPSLMTWYASEGYKVDDLALRAIATSPTAADRGVVCRALNVIYDPWLEQEALTFQAAAAAGYAGQIGLDVQAGTCVVFVDALRFDLALRLTKKLGSLDTTISPRLAAFPTVTPTGQPAVAPVRATFVAGQGFDAADSQGRSVKGQVFRSVLANEGVQFLDWKTFQCGDTNGIGWTQTSTIDSLGHAHDHALSDMVDQQLDLIAERIYGLIEEGWRHVVVATDHGFLLPAAPAQKVMLPLAATEGDAARKPRVARLKAGLDRPNLPIIPWTWDSSVDMVSAPGAAAFESGTIYEHGGLSPQECIIPVVEVSAREGAAEPAQISGIRWTGQRCRVDFDPAEADVVAEVRLAPAEPLSTVGGPKFPSEPGEIKVLVDEEKAAEGVSAYVVLLGPDGTVIAQRQTVVGVSE